MNHSLCSKEGDHYMRALLAWNRHLACSKAISSSGVSRLDQIDQLKYQKTTLKVKQPVEIEDLIRYTKFFFEHLDILLLQQSNPIAKANFFSLIFNTTPTFSSLEVRTPENKKTTEVSDVFLALLTPDDHLAGAEGFEPPNARTKTWCLTAWPRPNTGKIISELVKFCYNLRNDLSNFAAKRHCVSTINKASAVSIFTR